MFLRQSTSQVILFGPCLDITDGVTEETALTLAQADMRLSKDGGAFAQKSAAGNATHDSDGWYSTTLSTTDTATVGELILNVHQPANMLPVWQRYWVVEEAVYDAIYGASAAGPLQSTVAGRTLDVTAGGAAGIDWGNVENPTTALDLSGTDIQLVDTATDLTTKTGFSLAATGLDAIVSTATGMVEIAKAVWDRVLTGATHNINTSAGRRLRQLQEAGTYAGAIWVDTVNGTAGTTDFENGTDSNPVDTIADANTLAASLGISRFMIAPGSSITFAATQANQVFDGSSWTLALGGQSIDGTSIIGAEVSGIATNTAGVQYFFCCNMGAVTLPGDTHVITSGIAGTQTLGEAGDYFFDRCHSAIAGTSTPILDFGAALNASNVSVRNHSGGWEIQNMGAGTGSYNMSLEGRGQLVINANCSATSTVAIRGNFTVTDNAGGAVTLSDDARIDVAQINAQCDTALSDYDGPTNAEMVARTLVAASYFDPAADTVATVTNVGTVTGNVDGSVGSVTGAVGSVTGAVGSVTGSVGSVAGNVDGSTASVTGAVGSVAGNVDGSVASVTARVTANTDQIAGVAAAATQLSLSADTVIGLGTASGTPTTTTMISDIGVTVDDQYNGRIIIFADNTTTAALRDQATDITGCTAASNTLTFTALTTAPVSGDTFVIV